MSVAGYGKDDIEVKVEDGTLTVRSTNETNDVDENVIHHFDSGGQFWMKILSMDK